MELRQELTISELEARLTQINRNQKPVAGHFRVHSADNPLFLLPNNASELPMASLLGKLSFDTLFPGVRRAASPRRSAFLFATAREKDCAIPRNMA